MKENRTPITQVLALLCLTVFALCVLLVLLTAACVYRNLVDRGEETYALRTALQYLTTRVRQAETVTIGELDGCQALVLEETVDGEVYTTWVYCYEGWLRELYTVPGAKLPLSAGETVLEAESLVINLQGNLLQVDVDGDLLMLHIPAGWEVGS